MAQSLRAVHTLPRRVLDHRAYNEYFWAYVFLLPFLALFGFFTVLPLGWGVVISFQDYTAFKLDHDFVGFENYRAALDDPITWHSLKVSAIYTIATVPIQVIWPFCLAVMIQQFAPRLRGLYRAAFYLPGVTSAVVMTLVWVWIFYPMEGGLANGVLERFGFEEQLWFGDADQALPVLILISWLTGWGGGVVLYSAAMGGIPKSLYEAADLDCASSLTKFRRITWPLVRPTTLFLLVTGTIGSFQVFQIAYIATRGGPQLATTTFVYHIWITAFDLLHLGKGAALSVLLAILVMTVAIIQFRFMSTDVEY
jgi:multiple sugar transport system permease protein